MIWPSTFVISESHSKRFLIDSLAQGCTTTTFIVSHRWCHIDTSKGLTLHLVDLMSALIVLGARLLAIKGTPASWRHVGFHLFPEDTLRCLPPFYELFLIVTGSFPLVFALSQDMVLEYAQNLKLSKRRLGVLEVSEEICSLKWSLCHVLWRQLLLVHRYLRVGSVHEVLGRYRYVAE